MREIYTMTKKILVTGGAGFIGSHTCIELLNNGNEVVVVDNLYNANKKSLEVVERVTGKKLLHLLCCTFVNDVRQKKLKINT